MDMMLAGLFILSAWIAAFTVWAWPMAADWPTERMTPFTMLWRCFQLPIVCVGALWVPDLWLA